MYVKQGVFRLLLVYNAGKRNPNFLEVPIQKEIGGADYPGHGFIVVVPKGTPDPVVRKLGEAFKKVTDGPAFQKVLTNFDLACDYKDRAQLERNSRGI